MLNIDCCFIDDFWFDMAMIIKNRMYIYAANLYFFYQLMSSRKFLASLAICFNLLQILYHQFMCYNYLVKIMTICVVKPNFIYLFVHSDIIWLVKSHFDEE